MQRHCIRMLLGSQWVRVPANFMLLSESSIQASDLRLAGKSWEVDTGICSGWTDVEFSACRTPHVPMLPRGTATYPDDV